MDEATDKNVPGEEVEGVKNFRIGQNIMSEWCVCRWGEKSPIAKFESKEAAVEYAKFLEGSVKTSNTFDFNGHLRKTIREKLVETVKTAWDEGYSSGKLAAELAFATQVGLSRDVVKDVDLEKEFNESRVRSFNSFDAALDSVCGKEEQK